jgi:hypothetical protein
MERRAEWLDSLIVTPAHGEATRMVTGVEADPSIFRRKPHNTLILLDKGAEAKIRSQPAPRLGRGRWGTMAADRAALALLRRSHVVVNCHKVTTLGHLVGEAASQTAQEAKMPEPEPAIPIVQSAPAREKTFTRHPHDTLRSHLSCISASDTPITDGAADVSGR